MRKSTKTTLQKQVTKQYLKWKDAKIEQLADLEHRQWSHWTEYFLANLTPANLALWKKQISTPYKKLSEKEKESDREWARKALKILEQSPKFGS